ncbi:MAG: DNA primase [Bacteroidetes bacterium]|nr:MAG: DNA primase [Bacteroidota bacterium]
MIKPETIQKIVETAHVEEVIGDFVSLKKRGVNYLGLCPFHNEKTPSFVVSPAKGIYKCFGCGKAGNAVNFVMEHEHYSYPEALRFLAKKYNIEIEEEALTPEMQQQIDERESLFTLNTFVNNYFQENLFNTDEGKAIGLTYFKEREFLEVTIKKFQLGYALDKWDDYSRHAIENGFKKEVLFKTGVTIDKGDKMMDRFRGRVIFPIHNLTGKVIGFGGRILSKDKSTAKYVNSPQSEIYDKSKTLYGIYFARNAILKNNQCYLVEGYTDVISMHQAGIENVVASSGTSLTVEQIKLIKRFTPNITILYDGDPAGIKASFRGINLILEQGLNVKIVLFPEGDDPDSFVRTHSTTEVEEFIAKQSSDFISFKTKLLLEDTTGDPAARAALIKDMVETISYIPDQIIRTVYTQECSTIMDVPEQTLVNELNKLLRNKYRKKIRATEQEIPQEAAIREEAIKEFDKLDSKYQEQEIIRLLLAYGDQSFVETPSEEEEPVQHNIAKYVINDLLENEVALTDVSLVKIFNIYHEAVQKGEIPHTNFFVNHPDQEVADKAIELISTPYELSLNWKKNKIFVKTEEDQLQLLTKTSLLALKEKHIGRLLKNIETQLKEPADEKTITNLIKNYQTLKEVHKQINQALERQILP